MPSPSTWAEDLSKSLEEGWNSTIASASGLLDSATSSSPQGAGASAGTTQARQGGVLDEADCLCPLLVVQNPEGVTFTVGGLISNKVQQEVLEVRHELKSGCPDDVLLRAYVAESGHVSDGILVESALGFQLAFIDTACAFQQKDPFINFIRPENEMSDLTIAPAKRAVKALADINEFRKGTHVWATVTRCGSGLVHVHRKEGPLIMTVRTNPSADTANITDARGRLLASMVTRRNDVGQKIMVVQVGGGDAGLLLCSLMAALKLS